MRIIIALLAIGLAPLAFGQDTETAPGMGAGMGMGTRMSTNFAELDLDSDGKLSKEELGKVVPEQRLEQAFLRWDKNEDGSVSEEEFNSRPGPPGGMGMGMGG